MATPKDKTQLQARLEDGDSRRVTFALTKTPSKNIDEIHRLLGDLLGIKTSTALIVMRAIACYRQHLESIPLHAKDTDDLLQAMNIERDELFITANRREDRYSHGRK